MKKNAKAKVTKKNLKVKDLALKGSDARNVKGGAVGPCDHKRK